MIVFCHKNPLRFANGFVKAHAGTKSFAEQGYGHSVIPCPSRKALSFPFVLKKNLPCFSGPVPCVRRGCKGLLDGPSVSEPPRDIAVVEAKLSCPSGNGLSFPVESNALVGGNVGLLFFNGRPPAVLWAVAKVSIDSVNGCAFRAFAHVFEKVCESFSPSVTHRNPAPSVAGVARIGLSVASGQHVLVRHISAALRVLGRMPMFVSHCVSSISCNELTIRTKPMGFKRRNAEMQLCLG